ncbi:putative porin [Methylovirgula ligni]|uniref:Putative porin n=2 Tax=Methylovirgula ligni TaxID=569860 RepID=A0A3D9Z2H7_9HYPH|nr:carbohydrate porin [Methylovirgula ligni]REF89015.1 putative porin [Methylovirgula ligni]
MIKTPSESRRSGRLARMVVFAAAAAMGMAAIGQARADVTDQLLDQLRAKGVLTRGEYSKLKTRHAAEKAEMGRPRHYSKDGVVVVPDDRYLTRLDKGIGFHIPGLVTKEGEVGAIDVKISGDLVFGADETFDAYAGGNRNATSHMTGGLVTASPNQPYNSIQAGLLPSAIVLSIATNQMGYDLGFTIGAYTGGNNVYPNSANANGGGSPVALGTPGIDLRQVFGTVGTPTFGSVKIGRDLGLFGSDAILNDATLLGLGSPLTTNAPSNTSLGRIGVGYVYADWIPQVTYTTPDFNGFTASIGAFTPLDSTGGIYTSTTYTGHELPQVQAQIKWKGNIAPGVGLTLSGDGVWQQQKNDPATGSEIFGPTGTSANSWGVDGFGKLDVAGFSFVAYGYYGEGLGTTGLFLSGFDSFGDPRKSEGGYVQGSYTWDKFTFGASWGVSQLNPTAAEWSIGTADGLVKDNESIIGFARYQLTPWMALQAEFGHTWATNWGGYKLSEDDIWLGTAWFF